MPEIKVTQFLLPDGRQKEVFIERPDEIAAMAGKIVAAGYRFTVELLTTGHVSMAIEDDEQDHDIELVPNAPGVVGQGFDRLVTRFAATL
jgi:hypothetical protein